MVRKIISAAKRSARWIANLIRFVILTLFKAGQKTADIVRRTNAQLDKLTEKYIPIKERKGDGFWDIFIREVSKTFNRRLWIKSFFWAHALLALLLVLLMFIGAGGRINLSWLVPQSATTFSVLDWEQFMQIQTAYAQEPMPLDWHTICLTQKAVPLQNGVSGHHYRSGHPGIDLRGRIGDLVPSMQSGQVVYAGWNSEGYGNLVIVSNGKLHTYYSHLSVIYVTRDQEVSKGTALGEVGSTGNSTGPHLHYETRVGTGWLPINPYSLQAQQLICANQ